jgi:signal transduction histidine kinase
MELRTRVADPRQRATFVTLGLVVVLAAWTIAITVTPALRFDFRWPEVRLPLETAGAVVAALTAALSYLHFVLDRSRAFLFVALAFVAIAANRVVYGVYAIWSSFGIQDAAYQWMVGRLLMAALLVAGATRWSRASGSEKPARTFLIHGAGVVGLLVAGQAILWRFRSSLPPLADTAVSPEPLTGASPGLTGVDIALGLIGAGAFLLATILYLRAPASGFVSTWLPPALVLAAFSHVHYMFVPTVFSEHISTGDVLRLMFSGVLLVGLMAEVARTYAAERRRTNERAAAYELESARVRDLEESDRARVHMLKVLTHELLHPVAAVRSTSLALVRRWSELGDGRKRELVERIASQSRQLVDFAEDVPGMVHEARFVLSRSERTVGSLIEDVGRVAAVNRRLNVTVPEGVRTERVLIDPVRILQVFWNLLSNADKFSPPDEPVTVAAARDDGEVQFRVEDRGPGIPSEENGRIFEAFHRGRDPAAAGAGLGLYVARGIVEAHGGRIWVEQRPEGGSAFVFTIPRGTP